MTDDSNDLTSGNVTCTLLRFFWPLLLANLLQSLYGIVDMLVVGRYVGSVGLAAVSNASMLFFVVTSVSIGIGTGGTVRIAHCSGAGSRSRIKPTVDSMIVLSALLSLVVTAVLFIRLESLLVLINVPEEAMDSACVYASIVAAGTPFVFESNAACSLLRGQGDSRRPMYFIVAAFVVNVCLDLLLVGCMEMGVRGAAYATVAAQIISCVISVWYLYRGLDTRSPSLDVSEAVPILKVGAATAIQLVVVNISYALLTAILNTYGVTVAAAAGIGLKINTFAAMPCWAFGHAVTAMAGQSLGGGDEERAKEILWRGLCLNMLFTLLLVLFVNFAAGPILFLFDPNNKEVARIGVRYLRLCCSLNCLVYCAMYTFDAFATGAGDAFVAMINSLLDSFLIRVSLAWLLGVRLGYGYEGIFIAQALAPVVPAVIGMCYFWRGVWRRRG